jgi:2-hydroxy-6-oxo-octa-2,4-dienoate hydrolase
MQPITSAIGKSLVAHDHKTNYLEAGSGRPVFLLHGSGAGVSAFANWAKVIGPLAERFHVVAPDIAGFGHTELKPETKYDIKLWVAHFIGILDALGLDAVSVVGNSFGGALGLATALSHPTRIDKLILLGTPCGEFPMTDGLRAQLEFDGTVEGMRRAVSFFPFDPSIVTESLIEARHAAATQPGALEAFRRLMPAPAAGDERPIVRGIPLKALKTIGHEVLIIHGREDRVVPFDRALDMFQSISRAELHAFGNCGHWVQIERETAFLDLVTGFLSR